MLRIWRIHLGKVFIFTCIQIAFSFAYFNQIETDQRECLPNFNFVQPGPVVNIAKQFRISPECMLYPLSTKSLTQNWKACFFCWCISSTLWSEIKVRWLILDFFSGLTANPFPVMTTGISLCTNSHREFPVMNTGSLQWEQGFPVMKTGFSLWELVHREKPVLALYWPCTGLQCI